MSASLTSSAATVGASVLAVALVAFALLWSPSSALEPLLVADLRGQALVVLAPAHPEDARRIALPGGPHELLRLPDGRVLVSLEQSGALAVVDVDSGAIQLIEVGGVPHGLALHAGVVLVTDRSVDLVRRFALEGWGELAPVQTGAWPHAVAVTPGGALAVASAGPGAVYLDGAEVPVGETTETVAVRSDGVVAAAAATEGVVVLLSPEGDELARWNLGGRPVRVSFSPDGTTLAVALSAGHAVALIEDDRVMRVAVEGVPDGLAFSSDGRAVYVSDVFGGAVTAVDTTSGEVRAVLRAGESTGAILVSAR